MERKSRIIVDKQLLTELRSGDNVLYKKLFSQLQPALVNYAKEYVIDYDLSCSLVQDSFLKLWENRQHIKIGTNLNGYLYKSVRNTCLNHLRHIKVTRKYESNTLTNEYSINYEALKDKSAEKLLEDEIMTRLDNAIQKLPPKCRQVFIKSRFEGKTHKEISAELGIAEKTVENQIGKALKVIKEELKEFLPASVILFPFIY